MRLNYVQFLLVRVCLGLQGGPSHNAAAGNSTHVLSVLSSQEPKRVNLLSNKPQVS